MSSCITAIEIENFNAFGESQRIALRPITLLFGANSSGKSSILHALHYAREILDRGNVDADRTQAGGEFVDLGGFRNFVHNRDTDHRIRIGFELDLRDAVLPDFRVHDGPYHLDDVDDVLESAKIVLEIAFSKLRSLVYLSAYEVSINEMPFANIKCDADRHQVTIADINWDHPQADGDVSYDSLCTAVPALERVDPASIALELIQKDALPDWENQLDINFGVESDEPANMGPSARPRDNDESPSSNEVEWAQAVMRTRLSQLLLTPGRVLRDSLRELRYLGPVREKPARSFSPPRFLDTSRWATGLAAWEALFNDAMLTREVNRWMSEESLLGTGYGVRRADVVEMPQGDPLLVQINDGKAFDETELVEARDRIRKMPVRRRVILNDVNSDAEMEPFDVGEGIAQTLPVVVALLEPSASLVMIEQPELHVHPAVQVGLGELLIEAIQNVPRPMIIETHSEHLLLRLLRRIRETHEDELPADHPGLTPENLAVYYVEQKSGSVCVLPLRVDETGEFEDRWPHGFFEERADELFS